jgi:hypothetical protein
MPHIQIEIDFLTHPKTLAISPLAQLLFIRSLIYSATHLTDGFVPNAAIPQISYDLTQYERLHYVPANVHASSPDVVTVEELLAELLDKKRLKPSRKGDGYWIHDYLDYQLSKKQVLQLIENKRKAGQAGGQASAVARAEAAAQRNRKQNSTEFNPTPIPTPMTIPKEEEKKEKSSATHRLSDEEFLIKLRTSPAYKHCDLDQELAKMDTWILANPGRQKTRKFIVKWLNKIERPMPITPGMTVISRRPPPPPPKNDPIARGAWGRQYGDPRQYGYD